MSLDAFHSLTTLTIISLQEQAEEASLKLAMIRQPVQSDVPLVPMKQDGLFKELKMLLAALEQLCQPIQAALPHPLSVQSPPTSKILSKRLAQI